MQEEEEENKGFLHKLFGFRACSFHILELVLFSSEINKSESESWKERDTVKSVL